MLTRTMTLIFLAILVVAIAVYDTLVAVDKIPGNTISEITLAWAMKHPISVLMLGVALGIVIGHLFWPQFIKAE